MTEPSVSAGSQAPIRKRYPILRWVAAIVGIVAGYELGQAAGFYSAQASGLQGNPDLGTTALTAALQRSLDAGNAAVIAGAAAGFVATIVAEKKLSGFRPFLVGSVAGILAAVIAGAIAGWA